MPRGGHNVKRSEMRAGHARSAEAGEAPDKLSAPDDVAWLTPAPYWCPQARGLYEAYQTSPQSKYFTSTDAAQAWYVCNMYHDGLTNNDLPASHHSAVLAGMASLLTSERDRRQARIELSRKDDSDDEEQVEATVTELFGV